jgi:DNA-binding Lrp family transcriptional regulator
MKSMDLKDRKILYHLSLDCRQSNTQIGKKVGLTKDVVAYRINRLEELGVIRKYITKINDVVLGSIDLRFYYRYQYVTPERRKEIIDYFIQNKYTIIIHSLEGSFDLEVRVQINSPLEFMTFYELTARKYRDFFSEQVFNVFSPHVFGYHFLIDEKIQETTNIYFSGIEIGYFDIKTKLDEFDYQLLHLLNTHARMSTIEIATHLHSTSRTITRRIKKLIQLGVIYGFTIDIDYEKFGYRFYVLSFELKKYASRDIIIKYATKYSHLYKAEWIVGYGDLNLGFILENVNQVNEIIDDIAKQFPDVIRKCNYYSHLQEHKCQYLRDG